MTKWKRDDYRFWHSPLALGIIFVALVFFSYRMVNLIEKERETNRKKELVQEEIDSLKRKEASLSVSISKLETEEGREGVIREKFPVAKQGEKMVTIIEEEESKLGVNEEKIEHGFWNWFKNIFDN